MTVVLEGGVMRGNVLRELASRATTDPEFLERTREALEGTLARYGYHLTDGEMQLVSNLRHQSTGMSSEELAGTLAAGLAGRERDPHQEALRVARHPRGSRGCGPRGEGPT